MPELPEVETIRNDLKRVVLNKKITHIEVRLERLIKSDPLKFQKIIKYNFFSDIKRTGKLLQFELGNNPELHLLVHLKMTGQLVYHKNKQRIAGGHSLPTPDNSEPNKYTYLVFVFDDGSRLFYNDMRTFGALKIVTTTELVETLEKFGIEPLQKSFHHATFKNIIQNRKTNIKSVLLNQHLVSGIGNIYADEILFRAGVSPIRSAESLSNEETKRIFNSSNLIIKKAIQSRGTTFNNYVDGQGKKGSFVKQLKVYGRGGEKCLKCKLPLKKIKLNGRGTVFCPHCQK